MTVVTTHATSPSLKDAEKSAPVGRLDACVVATAPHLDALLDERMAVMAHGNGDGLLREGPATPLWVGSYRN